MVLLAAVLHLDFGPGSAEIKDAEQIRRSGDTYAQWVRKAVRLVSRVSDSVSLFDSSVAEPEELLREIVETSFRKPITDRYTSVFTEDNPFVIEALAARYGAPSENILCTTGATGAISLLYRSLLARGDHVLVETPGFDIFADMCEPLGVEVETFRRPAPAYEIDPEAVKAALKPNTRLVVISNLHNPSGMPTDESALRDLARIAEDRGIKVIVDEVYRDYVGGASVKNIAANISPAFITVSSLTKIFGLSSLRCGWIIADPDTLKEARAVHDKFEFGVSKLAHAVAAIVLERGETFDRYALDVVRAARPVLEEYSAALEAEGLIEGCLPGHGCIWFPKIPGIFDTCRLSEKLARDHGVVVVPGEYFSSPGHIRIGFALEPALLQKGMTRLYDGLKAAQRNARAKISFG